MCYFKFYNVVLMSALLFSGCSKDKVTTPDFSVSTENSTFKVGEEVVFKFSGNPENITFYSGMEGFRYDSIGKPVAQYGAPSLEFASSTRVGPGSIKLLMTSDLTELTAQNINSLNWIDISSRANFATIASFTPSGKIDLSDLVSPNQPVRFAFKYEGFANATTLQPVWSVNLFNLNATFLSGKTVAVQTLASSTWSVIDVKNTLSTWAVTSALLRIDGGARTNPDNEDWVVSNSIDLMAQIDAYEFGVPIKNITTQLVEYKYTYTKPGTYKVAFVGSNTSINGHKEVVRNLTITVLP